MSGCMPPRALLRGLLGLALGSFLAACDAGSPAPAGSGAGERPSVILISLDTLRADHMGLYGHERDTTPFLDRWARDAMVFEHAYTTAAWTLVAHMTMLTGLFPEQHDVIGSKRALSPEIPLLAERLRGAGYRTVGLYSPGWIDKRHGFDRGFEVFLPHEDLAQADRQLRSAMAELEHEKPFFLFVHLFDAHCGPFQDDSSSIYPAPEAYEHRFVTPDMKPWPEVPAKDLWWTRGVLGPEDFRTAAALYDGGIREVDDQLGTWFGELGRRGLLDDTLVIVTADHGEALGQRGILDRHGESYQEGLHVPLIVRDPRGRGAGTRVQAPVHLGDLVPTILDAVGLAADERLPGLSLLGPLPETRAVYGIKLPEAFILWGKDKYVLGPQEACLHFDLERDPGELSPERVDAARFHELRAKILGNAEPFPRAIPAGDLSEEDAAMLLALGYGGESSEKNEKKAGSKKAPPSPAPETRTPEAPR